MTRLKSAKVQLMKKQKETSKAAQDAIQQKRREVATPPCLHSRCFTPFYQARCMMCGTCRHQRCDVKSTFHMDSDSNLSHAHTGGGAAQGWPAEGP